MNKNCCSVLVWLVAGFSLPTAWAVQLDIHYGEAGYNQTNVSSFIDANQATVDSLDVAFALVAQADGKLISGGGAAYGYFGGLNTPTDMALTRHHPDGSLDTGFAVGGRLTHSIMSPYSSTRDLILQADGAIVSLVATYDGASSSAAMVRHSSNGSIDMSFGAAGVVASGGNAGIQQADGKLVVVGSAGLQRFDTFGVADAGFGTGGVVTPSVCQCTRYSIVEQSDAKLVIVGSLGLERFTSNGDLDTSFGTGGRVLFSENAISPKVVQQADGSLIVAFIRSDRYTLFLQRYSADGVPDLSFGVAGTVSTFINDNGSKYNHSLVIQEDGKLVAFMRGGSNTFLLIRYNTNGSLDDGFDDDGIYEPPFAIANSGATSLVGDMVYQSGAFYVLVSHLDDFYIAKFVEPEAPPVAGRVVRTNISQAEFGESNYSFTIDYSDTNGDLDVATINAADITVCDGSYCASVDSTSWSGNTFNGIATYNLTPPGGSWDAADIGIYTIAIAADEVADDLSTYVAANVDAGRFSVAMDAPPPPVASAVVAADLGQADLGASTYLLTIDYSDANGDLDISSIDTTDITVCSGGNCASVNSASWNGDASSGVATYILTPPGSSWDVLDSGTYTIAISANEVADTLSGFVAADANAGSFSVSMTVPTIPDPPIIGAATPADKITWIAFTSPANNGGAPIIDYTASCDAGYDATGVTSPVVLGGLTNGTTHYCYVTARNSVGSSAASGTVAVTPTAKISTLTETCTGTIAAGNHVLWGCTVPAGQTLTFAPGALLVGNNTIDVSGTVTANSAFMDNTIFVVQSGGVLNLNGVTFTGHSFGIRYLEGSSGSVTNSNLTMAFSNSPPYTIEITSASPTVSGNTFIANNGVLVSGDGANPTVEENNISFRNNGITFADGASTGSVSNNTLNFLDTSFATAILVNGIASPSISNNVINDHNQQSSLGIKLYIDAGSSVQVTNNTICATNGDIPLLVDPDYFAAGSTALISGNIFNCGGGRGISLGGTTTANGVFAPIQGQSELYLHGSLTVSAGDNFTFNNGKIKGATGNNFSILVFGTFTASNSTILNTGVVAPFSPGIINLNQMTLTGSGVTFGEGSDGSITNSQFSANRSNAIGLINAKPVITGNTFTGIPGGISTNNSSPTPLVLNIQNNIFNDVITGISLTGSIDATISDNQFNRNVSAISISGGAVTPLLTNNEFIANDHSLNFLDDAALFSSSSNFMQGNSFLIASPAFNSIGMPATISQSGTVPLIGAFTYYEIASTLIVPDSMELTLSPGIKLRFATDVSLVVEAGGSLIADLDNGASDPVSFWGIPGSPAPWSGISVAGNASFSDCSIQGAAFGLNITDASVQMTDCSVRYNQNGMLVTGASSSVTVTDSSIWDNSVSGISRLSGEFTISQSTIERNGGYGIDSTDSAPYVMARDNDWGHISGPLDNSDDTGSGGLYNPGGLGQSVSDYVDYDPWVGKVGPSKPGAPTNISGTPANGGALIAFTPPLSDGGESILDYTASCDAGTDATGITSPLMVTGLSNDSTYSCYVTARNSLGTSSASGSVSVTPTGGTEVTLPPSAGDSGEVVTVAHAATPPGGGVPVPATLSIKATEAAPPEPPAEAESLVSAIDIDSTSTVVGYTLVVTFTIEASSINEFTGFWKYGKETSIDAAHWYDYGTLEANGDGTGYELSDDKKTLNVYLVDGLRGDDDWQANASIVDPALPIVKVSSTVFSNGFE